MSVDVLFRFVFAFLLIYIFLWFNMLNILSVSTMDLFGFGAFLSINI